MSENDNRDSVALHCSLVSERLNYFSKMAKIGLDILAEMAIIRESDRHSTNQGKTMFYAANRNGKMFAKFYVSRGEKLPARYSTFEKSEAFVFGTAEEAESFASGLFRKDAGPAVAVAIAKPEQYIHGYAASSIPGYDPSMRRPSRHDIEEVMIHGAHELYS